MFITPKKKNVVQKWERIEGICGAVRNFDFICEWRECGEICGVDRQDGLEIEISPTHIKRHQLLKNKRGKEIERGKKTIIGKISCTKICK